MVEDPDGSCGGAAGLPHAAIQGLVASHHGGRLGPLGGDPSFDSPFIDCFGGAPANVACALSRLGVDVSFLGSLGTDTYGQEFKQLMIDKGINISGLQEDNLRPTRVVLVCRDAKGERSFGGFEGDKGFGFADQVISLNQISKDWPLVANEAKWLIIGTLPLASKFSLDAFYWCIEKASAAGIKILLDLNWRPTFWRDTVSKSLAPSFEEKKVINSILKYVSIIKLAKEEAQWFFDSFDPLEISLMLPNRPSIVVTDGSNPVSWIMNKNRGSLNAISPRKIVDTTGAGDAFTAGLIYSLLTLDLDKITSTESERVIRFAIGCGAYVCQGEGAIDSQPDYTNVEQFLSLLNGG